MIDSSKIIRLLRTAARTFLIMITVFWFVFALLSGSEELGGGLKGIVLNSPNALPWLLLSIIVVIAWKWELLGGLIIALFGLFTVLFFQTYRSPVTLIGISLPLITIGVFLIMCWNLTRRGNT